MRLVILTSVFLTTTVGIALADSEVVRFPANPEYGYVKRVDSSNGIRATYDVIRFVSDEVASHEVIQTVPAVPRLCSSESINYVIDDGDSARLIVLSLSFPYDLDTVITFLSSRSPRVRGSFIWPRPDNSRIVGLGDYFFSLSDSTLVWRVINSGRIKPIEIGRIDADGNYQYERGIDDGTVGRPSLDFQEVLLTESFFTERDRDYFQLTGSGATIMSYDLSQHSLTFVDSVSSGCSAVTRRFPGDTLWCLAYTGEVDQNLCRIENGQLVNVTKVHHPLRIADYRVYRDHIEIDTIRCGGDGLGPKN